MCNNENNYRNRESIKNYREMYTNPKTYKLNKIQKKMVNRLAKINICVTRKKVNEINKLFTKKWTDKLYSKDKKSFLLLKKGGRLISDFNRCLSNYSIISKLNKIGVYNNIFYNIMSYDDKYIKLLSEFNKIIKVPIDLMFTNKCLFTHGYAITAFRCQGMTIKHRYIGVHEVNMMRKNGRIFYTVFSRHKEKKSRSLAEIKERKKLSHDFEVSLNDFDEDYESGFNDDIDKIFEPIDQNEQLINQYTEELKDSRIYDIKMHERYLLAVY